MNIINNIFGVLKLYKTYPIFKKHKKIIYGIRAKGDDVAERQAIVNAMNEWSDEAFRLIKSTVNVYGEENLPSDGPVVFIANHQSYFDIPTIMKGIRSLQYGFIAKDTIGRLPIFGQVIDMIRGIYIHRENARDALRVIQEGCKLLERGFNMVIFPEGTRSWGKQMGRFKPGSFKLATKVGVPIVPITIDGAYKLYEEHRELRPATVNIVIHKPVPTKGLNRSEQVALVQKVKDIIASGFDYGKEKKEEIFDHSNDENENIIDKLNRKTDMNE